MKQDVFSKLEAIMATHRRMEKLMEPYNLIDKMMEPIKKLHPSTEYLNTFHKQIDSSFSTIEKNMGVLNDFHLKSPIFNSPLLEQFEKISKLNERIKEVFENTPQALLLLAEYGWYLDYDSEFSLPLDLAELIKEERIDELDTYLIKYYNDKFDEVIIELTQRHSQRKEIFSQISLSYKSGYHYVTIPCILAQIDGIANDFTKKKFFLKDQKNNFLPQVTAEITRMSAITIQSFLSPLTNQTPIMAHESTLPDFPVTLNRHTILHGISVDYGDEKNCLKCISLLKYLSDILIQIENK